MTDSQFVVYLHSLFLVLRNDHRIHGHIYAISQSGNIMKVRTSSLCCGRHIRGPFLFIGYSHMVESGRLTELGTTHLQRIDLNEPCARLSKNSQCTISPVSLPRHCVDPEPGRHLDISANLNYATSRVYDPPKYSLGTTKPIFNLKNGSTARPNYTDDLQATTHSLAEDAAMWVIKYPV